MKCCICGRDLTGLPAMLDRATGEAFCSLHSHYLGLHPSNRPRPEQVWSGADRAAPPEEAEEDRERRIWAENRARFDDELRSLVAEGKRALAMHEYRKSHPRATLQEAKAYVDALGSVNTDTR